MDSFGCDVWENLDQISYVTNRLFGDRLLAASTNTTCNVFLNGECCGLLALQFFHEFRDRL